VGEWRTQKKTDGKPITCKFCHRPIWMRYDYTAWNPGGEVRHIKTCEKRAKSFHGRAMDYAEIRRSRALSAQQEVGRA